MKDNTNFEEFLQTFISCMMTKEMSSEMWTLCFIPKLSKSLRVTILNWPTAGKANFDTIVETIREQVDASNHTLGHTFYNTLKSIGMTIREHRMKRQRLLFKFAAGGEVPIGKKKCGKLW